MKPLPDEPQVSVIIPTLNRAGLLPRALDSILAQDWPHLEVIVLDGGSTDDTPAVLARYTAEHPDRIRTSNHAGLGQIDKVNIGFGDARGDLLMSFGDDDLLFPGALSRLVREFQEHHDAVVAYPDYQHLDMGGNVLETTHYPAHDLREAVRLHICAPAFALFRRAVLDHIAPWDPALRTVSDWDFWWRCAPYGSFRPVFETLAALGVHEGSQSAQRAFEFGVDHVRLVEALYQRPDVPSELLEVRAEACANAWITAATIALADLNTVGHRYIVEDTLRFIDRAVEFRPDQIESDAWSSPRRIEAVLRRQLRAMESHEQEVTLLREAIRSRDAAISELRRALDAGVPAASPNL